MMKYLVYIFALLIGGTVMAQAKDEPTEVTEKEEVKTIKYDDGSSVTEKKVKVVTRETANVKLDQKDKNKVNQERTVGTTKIEKMVMVDDDGDSQFETLSKITYYVDDNNNYMFTKNERGFDIAFDKENEEFVNVAKAFTTGATGNYIINGESHNGIGYFDGEGNFVVEYYNPKNDSIEVKMYKRSKADMNKN